MKPFINATFVVVAVANVVAGVLAQGEDGAVPSQPMTSEPPTTTPSVFQVHVSDRDVESFVQALNYAPSLSTLTSSSSRILDVAPFQRRQVNIDLWLRLRAVVHVLGKYVPWTDLQPADNHDVLRFMTYAISIWNQYANRDARYAELDRVLGQHAGVLRAKLFPAAAADPFDLSRNVGAICKMLGEERNRISQSVDALLRRPRSQSVPAKDVERVLKVVQGSVRTIGRCEQLTQLVDQYLLPYEDKAVVDRDFHWALSKLELVVLEIERVLGVATASALVIVAYQIICHDDQQPNPIQHDEQSSTEEHDAARARDFLDLQKTLLKLPSYGADVVSPLSIPIHMQVQLYERAMSHGNQIRYEGRSIFIAFQEQVRPVPGMNPDSGRDLSSLMFLIAVLYRRPTLNAHTRAAVLDNYIEFLRTIVHAGHNDGFVLALAYALWRDENDTTRIAKCCVSAGSNSSAVLKVLSVLTHAPLRLRIPNRLVTQPGDAIVEFLLDAVIRGTIVAASIESDAPAAASSSKSRQKSTRRWFSTPIRCLIKSSSTTSNDGGGGAHRSVSPGPFRKQEKSPTATHVAQTLCQYV